VQRDNVMFALLSIDPYFTSLPMGGVTTLELRVQDVQNLYGLSVIIGFDPARLEVVDSDPSIDGVQLEQGEFPTPRDVFLVENTADNDLGRIRYSFTLIDSVPAEGGGTVARIRLRGRGPGVTTLGFVDFQMSDSAASPIAAGGRGAVVEVLEPPTSTPSPTVTPTATDTATSTPTNTTVPTSTATPTAIPSATETPLPSNTPDPSTTPPPATATAEPSDTPEPSATPPSTSTSPATVTATQATPTEPSPTPSRTSATATDAPTQTRTATPTPTRPTGDECVRPLVNGGFESEEGWVLRGARIPRLAASEVHSGERSMLLGIKPNEPNEYSYSTIWQPVPVPSDARTLSIAAWTYQGAEPGGGPDRQLVLIYDIDPSQNREGRRAPIAYVFGERVDARVWQRRTLTIDVSDHRGGTLWVYSTVMNDGMGGRAWMYLDDVEVVFCP
jgi:hypothetical protein